MTEQFCIRVAKERFTFSAGHFITLQGDICERLHGHNYRVAAELRGPLGSQAYVYDFIRLRDAVQSITSQLDHRMLLPAEHPAIVVRSEQQEVTVTFEKRRWVFPAEDCQILPVTNTTAEMLARYIGQRLIQDLGLRSPAIESVKVEIDECDGQLASWEVRLASATDC